MIEYISGEIAELSPTQVIIDCNGIGYGLNISLNTYSSIQGKKEIKIYVYEAIREDAYILYGFVSKDERTLFLHLISVSGIGGNTARMILSAFTPRELCDLISAGNDKLLKNVKGIGMKTAQRIIIDLKDKIPITQISENNASGEKTMVTSLNSEKTEEAVAALTMLGFSPAPTQKIVISILSDTPDIPVEAVIKKALKML
ncbi:MAG: Holliday junction branch migration protein RuvA [Bacteroidaceae bacterium]